MRSKLWIAILVLLLALALAPLPTRSASCRAISYTVTNTSDSGDGSLRWAINQANSDGEDSSIYFAIPGAGVHTIQPLSSLPALVEDTTRITGQTQPGWAPATDTTPATIVVEIDGSLAGPGNGLSIISADNRVVGLAINCFPWNGIAIFSFGGSSATGNVIAGNHIGINAAGTVGLRNGYTGVSISLGAQNNRVGGILPSERNVISGNGWEGVGIHGIDTTNNRVSGNYIGAAANGTDDLGNTLYGVRIYGGAHGNTVGGDTPSEQNIIAGNDQDGVRIAGADTRDNVILGNDIGRYTLGNSGNGVIITDGAHENTVGPGNTIAKNNDDGVHITGASTMNNTISGNNILGNTGNGILISAAQGNTVGGDTGNELNRIYSNDGHGVAIDSLAQNNTVSGNYIGVGEYAFPRGNGGSGVFLDGSQNNTIGGDTLEEHNVIFANGLHGIELNDAQDNTIAGNYIGTHINGEPFEAYGNIQDGIRLDLASTGNTIGGDTTAERNLIYSNGGHGVHIFASAATGNHITHNSIEYNVGEGIKVPDGWTPAAPTIVTTTPGSVHITGTSCAGCSIEVFQSHLDSGEGLTFVGDTIADSSGAFTITVDSLSQPYLTATATDAISGTSEFSAVFTHTVYSVFLPLVSNSY